MRKFRKKPYLCIRMISEQSILQRAELLLGDATMSRLSAKRVIVFGVGGVGSWCAEGLVRTGIRRLTIVDSDVVCPSNINRQLMATTQTVGRPKVEVLRERLLSINPHAEVLALQRTFCEETADSFGIGSYDYVVDAIDSLRDKALLIRTATDAGVTLYSSMGAALKLDPTRIRVTEFWKVEGDPLARALRKRFKREGRYPIRKFQCVYSDEQSVGRAPAAGTGADSAEGHANGSLVHVTAIFGFTLAGLVVQDIGHTCRP